MLRGSFFEISGFGAQYVLRSEAGLITTRLLLSRGVRARVDLFVITTGLVMLSDVAVQPCIVQSKRGETPAFLNTRFTTSRRSAGRRAGVAHGRAGKAALVFYGTRAGTLVYLGSLAMIIGGCIPRRISRCAAAAAGSGSTALDCRRTS